MDRQYSVQRNFRPVCLLAVALTILGGCAIHAPQSPLSAVDATHSQPPHALLEQAKTTRIPVSPPFSEQIIPPQTIPSAPPRLYTMVFENAPLGQVIAALTKDTEFNLSIESEVDLARTVTVNLKNVTLAEALEMIVVKGAGYAWKLADNNLDIKRFAERIYHFDGLDMVGETVIDVGGDMLGSGVENSGVSGKYQIKAQKPQTSSDVWLGIEQALSGLKSEEGILRFNRNAGVIYLADTPRRLAAMTQFLDSLAESLNRQVLVEARIMEVTLNDDNKYGIDWSQVGVMFTDRDNVLTDVFNLGFNSNGAIVKGSQTQFTAMLDFLKTQGDVKILSNPHLTVMNRQSALLTIGYQFPYADIDGVDRDSETGVVTIGTSIRRAVLGLQLGMTTHISADGMVTFHIVPTLTRIQREVKVEIPLGTTAQTISNPVIDLQELATTVRVREGQPFVLAGLISKIRSINHQGLPLLGQIPGLGNFFKHMAESEQSSELVIVVTPYIRPSV